MNQQIKESKYNPVSTIVKLGEETDSKKLLLLIESFIHLTASEIGKLRPEEQHSMKELEKIQREIENNLNDPKAMEAFVDFAVNSIIGVHNALHPEEPIVRIEQATLGAYAIVGERLEDKVWKAIF